MANNIYLHLGAHKTASTYLQRLLLENNSIFRARDTKVVLRNNLMKNGLSELFRWHNRVYRGKRKKYPADLKLFLESLGEIECDSVLISYEGFLGRMDLSRTGTIYPFTQKSAYNLADSFSGKNIKVAFCVRNYADFIESSYKWLVSSGRSFPFDEYMAAILVDELSWRPVLESLGDCFGKDNVILWRYEDYRVDYKKINHGVLDFFFGDIGEDEISYEWDVPVNVSLNIKKLKSVIVINKWIDGLPLSKVIKKNLKLGFRVVVDKDPLFHKGGKKPSFLGALDRRVLSERYESELIELRKAGFNFISSTG